MQRSPHGSCGAGRDLGTGNRNRTANFRIAQFVIKVPYPRHLVWPLFLGAVENFRFLNLEVYALTDPQGAVAEVKGQGLIKSTGRMYRQVYVVFLRAADGKIAFLREYFGPVRAAKALDTPILGLLILKRSEERRAFRRSTMAPPETLLWTHK